jgi:hypothetical protein
LAASGAGAPAGALSGQYLLAAVDVVARAGERGAGHEVHGEPAPTTMTPWS